MNSKIKEDKTSKNYDFRTKPVPEWALMVVLDFVDNNWFAFESHCAMHGFSDSNEVRSKIVL